MNDKDQSVLLKLQNMLELTTDEKEVKTIKKQIKALT
jgi:hypothetical protein